MREFRTSSATLLLAVIYLLVSTFALTVHQHEHALHESPHGGSHFEHGCQHPHDHLPHDPHSVSDHRPNESPASPRRSHSHDCAVCMLLAQAPMAAVVETPHACTVVVSEPPAVAPVQPVLRPVATHRPRAPPTAVC